MKSLFFKIINSPQLLIGMYLLNLAFAYFQIVYPLPALAFAFIGLDCFYILLSKQRLSFFLCTITFSMSINGLNFKFLAGQNIFIIELCLIYGVLFFKKKAKLDRQMLGFALCAVLSFGVSVLTTTILKKTYSAIENVRDLVYMLMPIIIYEGAKNSKNSIPEKEFLCWVYSMAIAITSLSCFLFLNNSAFAKQFLSFMGAKTLGRFAAFETNPDFYPLPIILLTLYGIGHKFTSFKRGISFYICLAISNVFCFVSGSKTYLVCAFIVLVLVGVRALVRKPWAAIPAIAGLGVGLCVLFLVFKDRIFQFVDQRVLLGSTERLGILNSITTNRTSILFGYMRELFSSPFKFLFGGAREITGWGVENCHTSYVYVMWLYGFLVGGLHYLFIYFFCFAPLNETQNKGIFDKLIFFLTLFVFTMAIMFNFSYGYLLAFAIIGVSGFVFEPSENPANDLPLSKISVNI